MEEENTEGQNGQEPERADKGSPVPDPEEQNGDDAEDVPEAD
jgi:hypothetical protein